MMPPKLKRDILKMPILGKLRLLTIIQAEGKNNLLMEVCALLMQTPKPEGGLSYEEITETLYPCEP